MKWIAVFLFLCCTHPLVAQPSDTTEIKTVVNRMFTAMMTADTALLRTCFTDSAILQTVTADGSVKTEPLHRFVSSISRLQHNDADERIRFEAIHLDGMLASVWTPYRFYYKGNFSHCGTNSFQMVKQNGSWKIQYIIDTRRKSPCAE